MLYMREDDMDEMMRKAAENYEVDADKAADWNFVYKAVHESGEDMPLTGKRKRRFMFWWLLFIPLGWLAHTGYNKFHTTAGKPAHEVAASSAKTKTQEPDNLEQSIIDSISSFEKTSTTNNATKKTLANTANNFSVKQSITSNSKTIVSSSNAIRDLHDDSNMDNADVENKSLLTQPLLQPAEEENNSNNNQAYEKNEAVAADSLNIKEQKNSLAVINNNSPDTTNKNNIKTANAAGNKKSSVITLKSSGHYFYTGLIAGADMSFIKYQETKPLGYNFGLLVGYKFNKLSIESGLMYDKKNYYTDGRYFDKSKIPYFINAQILTVDGYCQMYEIPLNIKYNFIEKNRHTFFATAGASSYLMHKEFYNYDYLRDNEQHYGSREYMHATKNWFSILNLSVGYQLQTGKKMQLRIEPYYKAPLGKVGTGSLPISSAGINAGIIRQIP